jgi:hypothetical protein
MAAPNFELITELNTCMRRDFPVAAQTADATGAGNVVTLSPIAARPLTEGEWLRLNAKYMLERGGDNNSGTADEEAHGCVFPVHTERGRYDTQAIGKVNVIMAGLYEAETLVHAGSATIAGYSVGDQLVVADTDNGEGIVRRGLKKKAGSGTVVGLVTKVTGSKLRFLHLAAV